MSAPATTTRTFESDIRTMQAAPAAEGFEKYFADPADPLHAAFKAKIAVHSGMSDMPLFGEEAQAKLQKLWQDRRTGKTLAYFHVPYCETRCLYCLFYQNPWKVEESRRYADLLIRELTLWSDQAAQLTDPIHAVYFGGGTPTALEPADIVRIMKAVRQYLPLANDCEITLEGRIHNFTDAKMEAALEGGVNRFSLGVQTFNSAVRQAVMRVDDRDTIISRLEHLCSYDNAAVVIDLIYGFPSQSMDVWKDDLATAASLKLDGIDCYQLNVFEKSPLAKYIANGKMPAAADVAMKADMFAESVRYLTDSQWRRLSNNHWANTKRERNFYNEMGKSACDCLAFGCGAGGRLAGHSFMMERKLDTWVQGIEEGKKPVAMLTNPGPHWALLRTVSSHMELGEINLKALGARFGLPLDVMVRPVTDQWEKAGLITRTGDWLLQTVAGQYWHVTLAQKLIEALSEQLIPRKPEAAGAAMHGTHPGSHPGGHPGARPEGHHPVNLHSGHPSGLSPK